MKIKLYLKDSEAIKYATDHLSIKEQEKAIKIWRKYAKFGEYITLILDLEDGTCTVQEIIK